MPQTKIKRSRPKPGDVYEFDIADGRLAYMQYLLEDTPQPGGNGSLVRVFPGTYAERPLDLETALPKQEQFLIFFPVYGGLGRGVVRNVGRFDLPERLRVMPKFKDHIENPQTHTRKWFLVDRTGPQLNTLLGDTLPREYLDYPYALLAGLDAIREKLLDGWTHRTWVRANDISG